MTKRQGFTLTEVLIALLVLGIIIASSVPVIMKVAPNKNVAMIKKAYYTTETIVNGLINDPYYYPDFSFNCQGGTSSGESNSATGGTCYYGFDYPQSVRVANTAIDTPDNASGKFRCLFASQLNIKENLSLVCQGARTEVTTMDGMTWNFDGLSMDSNNSQLYIDVDGQNYGVNSFVFIAGNSKTGLCANNSTWGNACNNNLSARAKKNFDRIQINIHKNGKIEISSNQIDFIDIISGKKKIISDDD